jgi:hypothetical protein
VVAREETADMMRAVKALMGWRKVVNDSLTDVSFGSNGGGEWMAQELLSMSDADRIALAAELLAGTGYETRRTERAGSDVADFLLCGASMKRE